MTTIDPRDISAALNDRALRTVPGSIEKITYRVRDGLALRQALLIHDVEGLLAAAGMTRLTTNEEDD